MTASAKEARVAELLQDLDGKSETTQRPIIDEIVRVGHIAIKPLSKALSSGASFQVRMASATALGELSDEKCVDPLVAALGDSSLNVQRAAVNALSLLGEPAVPPLLLSLDSPEESVRSHGVKRNAASDPASRSIASNSAQIRSRRVSNQSRAACC